MTELRTVDEAAKRLRISRRSLYRLIDAGRIRVVHPTPGRTMVTDREIEAHLASLEKRRRAA